MRDARAMEEDGKAEPAGIREMLAGYRHAITAQELAAILRVEPDMVYKNARAGIIPHFRIGTSVRFDPKDVADWIDQQQIGRVNRHRAK